ncbi:ribokinase [Bisgaardia hudsonensis]|uniref:Ribokinase n=1 Tax=Bisgaardia hudsonensis TaxID=109472 RepID=A0A4R2MUL6_9PAST|nr:ribokinase [Bisgaardia hudsonensis]QLB12335.1 ribokinase [Bisgaardia hudsonensis]TCP12382.1 ribokinase [Bisgaardia hudsonensis]
MKNTLTVLGSINVDHVISVPHFAKPGETLTGKNYYIAYGGKGANQAVAAARLKHSDTQVNFISCLGYDPISDEIKQAFVKDGINTQAISKFENETTGLAMIQVADSGENSIVISAGANARLDEQYVAKHRSLIADADYLLMQLETPINAILQAAITAKENNTKVILNPAPAQPLSDELLSFVDIITPNETEAEILTGIKVTDQQSAVKSAEVFHKKGIDTVLITLGSKGVYLSQNGQGQIISGFRVNAIDTTAAGDTFNGAFIVALLEGKTLDKAIQFAHAAAAISVTRKGAQPSIPTRDETLTFLKQQS